MTEEQFKRLYAEYLTVLEEFQSLDAPDLNCSKSLYVYQTSLDTVASITDKLFAEISASHGYRMEIENAD
jgi:hypothetical protein